MCSTPKVATKYDLFSEYVRKHDAKDSNRVHKIKRHQFNIYLTRIVSSNFNRLRKQMSMILLTMALKVLVCFGKSTSYISLGIVSFENMSKNDIIFALNRYINHNSGI